MTTIPLRNYKAITIYKSQGITAGPGKARDKVVVQLPTGRQRKITGSEIVVFFRASHITGLAIENSLHEIDRMILFKIGKVKAFDKRKSFEILQSNYETRKKYYYVDKTTRIDTLVTKTYSGRFYFLLLWFRNKGNP